MNGEGGGALVDCLVIGGGPAGLTAAIYLARFHLSVTVVDADQSRLSLVPLTRNHPGFPEGISGHALLKRMRQQATRYGAVLRTGEVRNLLRNSHGFTAHYENLEISARSALLATGVVNRRPRLSEEMHRAALAAGQIRYCPICDAYEVTDRRIAVIGTGTHALKEAEFLRSYTADITLVSHDGPHDLKPHERERLHQLGIAVLDGPCLAMELSDHTIEMILPDRRVTFESAYPALGSVARSDLAARLGVALSEEGCILVDDHQRTDLPGLYAAGDVVPALDQISAAMGMGAIAATAIRNDLCDTVPRHR